jgi:transposase
MFTLGQRDRYHLYSQPTDMRKSFDGLCGIISQELQQSPTGGDVFIFINKNSNKMKLLQWSGSHFVLYYKRLEQGTFERFTYALKTGSYQLSYSQLVLLVDGISIRNLDKKRITKVI